MNFPLLPYHIFAVGDSTITLDFGNFIDESINKQVIARYRQLQQDPLYGMIEAVPAYSSITIHYDVVTIRKLIPADKTVFESLKQQLEERLQQPIQENQLNEGLVKIPVCYEDELAMDIQTLAAVKNISVDEVIHIHTSAIYKVYMLGFLPGFPYMGQVDDRIATPRKLQPQTVEAGSVGIAGKQTGIYPLTSPGGWQIIGRTPLKLFDVLQDEPTLLKAGDSVQFYSITKKEFYEI